MFRPLLVATILFAGMVLAADHAQTPFADDFNDGKWDDAIWQRSSEQLVDEQDGKLIVNGSADSQWVQSRRTFAPGAQGVRLEVVEIHRGHNSFVGFSDRGGAEQMEQTHNITFRTDQDKNWWIQIGDVFESTGVAYPEFNSGQRVRFCIEWKAKSVTMTIDVGDDGKLEFHKSYEAAIADTLPIYFRNQRSSLFSRSTR